MKGDFKYEWRGTGRQPQCAPDPHYPNGIALKWAKLDRPACSATLPYPADCIGTHRLECRTCGLRVAVTAAGRPDDPTEIHVNCKEGP